MKTKNKMRLGYLFLIIAITFLFSGCETAPLFRGYRCFCRGSYKQSITTFTYYLNHSSDRDNNKEARAAGFFYRGLAKTELGMSNEACADYREALARVPDFFYASFNLGVENFRQKKYDLSLPMFRAAWKSMSKAERGELDESQLWNRKVFNRDREYCFYYYGMALVMGGEIEELGALIQEADTITFKEGKVVTAREMFRKIVAHELSVEEGRKQIESMENNQGCRKSRCMV